MESFNNSIVQIKPKNYKPLVDALSKENKYESIECLENIILNEENNKMIRVKEEALIYTIKYYLSTEYIDQSIFIL